MDEKHNGWTNYATWRVRLEYFDSKNYRDYCVESSDDYDNGKTLKAIVESDIEENSSGNAMSYALAFLSEVNWTEIAEHWRKEK